LFSCSAPS